MKSQKGRGATINPDNRFAKHRHEAIDDGWDLEEEPLPKLKTTVFEETCKSVITYNESPDLPFDRSINPYRGCEHGCSYCYARPSHAYLDLSPGLDFETKLIVKTNLHEQLKKDLSARNYRCQPISLGTNTDPYQPIEKNYRLTRGILEILLECKHPVVIVTKASLVERDIDLLAQMAEHSLAQVMLSIPSLDKDITRRMEPRAASPMRRLQTLQTLSEAGIPTGVMVAPIVPQLTDGELEKVLEQAASRGARSAAYVMLRLPREVSEIFTEWLQCHYPLKASHVLNTVRDMREGKINDSNFGSRMTGKGAYASMIAQRFQLYCKKVGLSCNHQPLETGFFHPPAKDGQYQLSLF